MLFQVLAVLRFLPHTRLARPLYHAENSLISFCSRLRRPDRLGLTTGARRVVPLSHQISRPHVLAALLLATRKRASICPKMSWGKSGTLWQWMEGKGNPRRLGNTRRNGKSNDPQTERKNNDSAHENQLHTPCVTEPLLHNEKKNDSAAPHLSEVATQRKDKRRHPARRAWAPPRTLPGAGGRWARHCEHTEGNRTTMNANREECRRK